MSISLTCNCGKEFRAKDHLAGKSVVCPACKKPVAVPVRPDAAGEVATPAAASVSMKKGRGATRNILILAGVSLFMFVVGMAVGHFALPPRAGVPVTAVPEKKKPDAEPAAGAMIKADPNPVPLGLNGKGTTSITWDTGDGSKGWVFCSWNNNKEGMFAKETVKGTKEAPWIGKRGVYDFNLYTGTYAQKKLVATVKVTPE